MRSALFLVAATLLFPASSFAAPAGTTPTIDPMDVGASQVKKPGKKGPKKGLKKPKKKGKKGKKQAEEAPPPPPPDGDKDGVIDADDKCPEEAEDQDLHEDEDGCPDPDNDGDGILDAADDCPFEAESMDGWDDEDGCPEEAPVIKPLKMTATLLNGTKVSGLVRKIVAVD